MDRPAIPNHEADFQIWRRGTGLGQHEAARQLSEDSLTRYRRVLGDAHPDTLLTATILATALSGLAQHDAAHNSSLEPD